MVVLTATLGGGCLSRQAVTLDLSGAAEVRLPQITGVNTNFFLAPEELGNDEVWDAVGEANIPVMRFPGGRGNRYDWETGVARSVKKPDGNAVPSEDFMARARSEGVSVDYVLNITDSPESIRELARSWRQMGAPVRRVEMGNEYYLPKLVGDIGGPEGYLERARASLQALRAGGYQGPVGLVAASEEEDPSRSAEVWNGEISRANTSDFDAVVLHHYPSLAQDDFETVYEESPSELAASVERLRERFPGKQVWVTEWNLGNPPDAPEFNTLGHALFDLRTLKALADARVDLAFYHVLTGRGWEFLGPDRFALDYEDEETRLTRRVPYFAFQMMGVALSDGASYMSGTRPAEGVEYMAFRTRDELRIVAWTLEGGVRDVRVEMDGPSPRFLGGEALRGDLADTNGSLLRMRRSGEIRGEEVKPVPLGSPQIEGPGAVLLRYAL